MNRYHVGVDWRPNINSSKREFKEYLVKARNRDQALFIAGQQFREDGNHALAESIRIKVTRGIE